MKRIGKTLALLFALVLCLGMLPGSALAAGEDGVRREGEAKEVSTRGGYLTFSSDTPFTLETANHTRNWDGTLKYSTNGWYWRTWNGSKTLSSSSHNGQQRLYLRGTGNAVISGAGESSRWVLTGSNVACSGNIENLLNHQTVYNGQHPLMDGGCFRYLFYNCTALTAAPELPATALSPACYYEMFDGCTSLTTAPALPATTLKQNCYANMFSGCTSLTSAPALPATTLAVNCYSHMFEGCTSMTFAPVLPATTLADKCYDSMFAGCTSLLTVPELPAMTLADNCYENMFADCTSLAMPAVLPATLLPDSCYADMFSGCTGIRVSETLTDEYCVPYRVPSAGNATFSGSGNLNFSTGMFSGSGGPFTGAPEPERTYYLAGPGNQPDEGMLTFSSEASFTLKTANRQKNWNGLLFYSTDAAHWTIWDGAAKLNSGRHNGQQRLYLCGLGNNNISGSDAQRWVLTAGPAAHQGEPTQRGQVNDPGITCSGSIENLLDYHIVLAGEHPLMSNFCFAYLFANNTSLTGAPALPALEIAPYCYASMFQDCSALAAAPALPATLLDQGCYTRMFQGCTSLKTAPALPALMAPARCYERMFANCTALTALPALPAWHAGYYSYAGMFQGCTLVKLSEVQTSDYTIEFSLPIGGPGGGCPEALTDMFAETGGTFTGTPDWGVFLNYGCYYLHNSNNLV